MSFKFQDQDKPRLATNYHPIELNENIAPTTSCIILTFGLLYFTKWKRSFPRGYGALIDTTLAVVGGYGWAYATLHAKKKAASINNDREEDFEEYVLKRGAPPYPLPQI